MISNGFDETRLLPVMLQRKGWRQPTLSSIPTLNTANLTCKSGKPFSDHHALCTLQNVIDTQEDPALEDSAANFNTLLENMNKSVCMESMQAVFSEEAIIDQPSINCGKGCDSELIEVVNTGRFVGIRIKVAEGNYAVQVNRLALMFDSAKSLNVYLYNDLKKAPLKTKSVTTVADDQTMVDLDEWVLRPIDSTSASRVFYIGYFQDDLGDTKAYDYGNRVWHCYKLAGVSGIEATANYPDFDRVNVNVSDRVYGITAEISSYKDFSNTIVQRVADFDQLIGDIMARNIIELIIYNRRSNQGQRITEEKGQMIYTDLNQEQASEQSPYTTGLKASIRKEIKRLKQTFYPKQTITVSVPHC